MDSRVLKEYLEKNQFPIVRKRYHKYLTFEGVEDCYTYILKEGTVKASVISNDGREFNLRYIKDLEIVSLLKDEYSQFIDSPYNIRIESEYAEFYRINRVKFWEHINEDPKMQHYVKEYYRYRLLYSMKKMQQMLLNGKLGAVCTQLYELYDLFGVRIEEGMMIDFVITNEEIAKFCGISTASSVSRILKQLKENGIITVKDHRIIITNMDLLEDNIIF
ncbi:CarD family transcriptional regulator [Enterococcus hirae EnGen0127]|uniref:Crp/Fnr family transcriptional regulator n=1 Tax=Enterococcus hirae TaxID=1354 RepID=UPI00032F2332|nr:Crp/Fnr family transcriptional regulator [Enterococcus hirae]EOF61069.1 CarD family transcriptional regulator [Enterococcus hirae EnGen0127]OWW47373.1 Crp/Fnr family transcriptional regulator [Enterococcus hirae 81-15-F4]OWW60503.1 Crp/Fnr family transcriptional regulator [Enterococcus hirae 88-15-E09]